MANVEYNRINWKQSPSTKTPLSADNLNNMDKGIDDCATQVNQNTNDIGSLSEKVTKNTSDITKNTSDITSLNENMLSVANTNEVVGGNAINLLNNTITTQTVNGVTFTKNSDGTVTVSGTASADSYITILYKFDGVNNYTVSGCPSGGSATTYNMYVIEQNTWTVHATDMGTGVTSKFSANNTCEIRLWIAKGYTSNNLVFKPMIEKGTVKHNYIPYIGGDLINVVHSLNENLANNNLNNRFDGRLLQGYRDDNGTFVSNTTVIAAENKIPCNEGDTIKIITQSQNDTIGTNFYKSDGSHLCRTYMANIKDYTVTAPESASYFNFDIKKQNGVDFPISSAGAISVYINSPIDNLKQYRMANKTITIQLSSKHQYIICGMHPSCNMGIMAMAITWDNVFKYFKIVDDGVFTISFDTSTTSMTITANEDYFISVQDLGHVLGN